MAGYCARHSNMPTSCCWCHHWQTAGRPFIYTAATSFKKKKKNESRIKKTASSHHQVKKRGKTKQRQKRQLKRSLGWLTGTRGRSFDCGLLGRRFGAMRFFFIIKKLLWQVHTHIARTKAGMPRGRRLQQVRDKACVCSALNYSTCDSLESGLRKARTGGISALLRSAAYCAFPSRAGWCQGGAHGKRERWMPARLTQGLAAGVVA